MARASIETILSLDHYAQLIGINPCHFSGVAGTETMPITNNACQDVWCQHSWQASDMVSREDMALAINAAESAIAEAIGYWPAPVWISEEVINSERYHRHDVVDRDLRTISGAWKQVRTRWGKVISPGRRAVSLIEAGAAVVYSDEDGDGIDETATVTVATTETDVTELKVYFASMDGDATYEIRPPRTRSLVGGVFTAVFWTWQLLNQELAEALTDTGGFRAADLSVAANFVTTVDVYREYNDTTQASAEFYWTQEESACSAADQCSLTIQTGCFSIVDPRHGIISPRFCTYTDGVWVYTTPGVYRVPEFVKVWYRCGDIKKLYRSSTYYEQYEHSMAEAVAWLATARLDRPFCSCANVTALATSLREDLAAYGRDGGHSIVGRDLDNPFGTRRGEVYAWRRVSRLADVIAEAGVV